MDIHLREFSGTTFGMSVEASSPAFRRMKKNAFTKKIKPRGSWVERTVLCVRAADVAAVMGEAGWLSENCSAWRPSAGAMTLLNTTSFTRRRPSSTARSRTAILTFEEVRQMERAGKKTRDIQFYSEKNGRMVCLHSPQQETTQSISKSSPGWRATKRWCRYQRNSIAMSVR